MDAVGQARQRCWSYDWVVDLDIKGFFDNIPHDLLLRAVKRHAPEPWVVLYIERWLQAPAQEEDGQLVPRVKGTPQGGVMTPRTQKVTSNLSGDCGFGVNRVRIDACRRKLYVYDRCHAPAVSRRPSDSIAPWFYFSKRISFPMLSNNWRRIAPFHRVKPTVTSSRLSN